MTVYPGMHCGCTLIVHRPLITLSKRRYVNEKTRYKTLISIPLELTYLVKIYLTILSTCGWQMSSEMLLQLVVILLFVLVSACSFESGMLFHWTLYSIQRNDITSEKYLSINMRDRTWSMCLSIVVSLCELKHEYIEHTFVHCCFCVWVRIRIHGVSVCA